MDVDIKPEFQDYNIDMVAANSSNDSQSSDFTNKLENKNVLNDMKDILEMHGTSLDYLKDVNELDIESVEDAPNDVPPKQDEQKLNIDPDDDMAGIMMELQKDRDKIQTETWLLLWYFRGIEWISRLDVVVTTQFTVPYRSEVFIVHDVVVT